MAARYLGSLREGINLTPHNMPRHRILPAPVRCQKPPEGSELAASVPRRFTAGTPTGRRPRPQPVSPDYDPWTGNALAGPSVIAGRRCAQSSPRQPQGHPRDDKQEKGE